MNAKRTKAKPYQEDAPPSLIREIERIVAWYLRSNYWLDGRVTGEPFFSDPGRVGRFAVTSKELARNDPEGLFRLLVSLAFYQARRDVDIMAKQRAMHARDVRALASRTRLRVLVEQSRCEYLSDADLFDRCCDVKRASNGGATCGSFPRRACHVKDATNAIRRMGDMGKIPTSAHLHLADVGLDDWFRATCNASSDPKERAAPEPVNEFETPARISLVS